MVGNGREGKGRVGKGREGKGKVGEDREGREVGRIADEGDRPHAVSDPEVKEIKGPKIQRSTDPTNQHTFGICSKRRGWTASSRNS